MGKDSKASNASAVNSKPVTSKWVVEKGKWDSETNSYVDRTFERFTRQITMKKEIRNGKLILDFLGGPTGFESYYIEDIKWTVALHDEMCICGGTINRWPACYVNSLEVLAFIKP